MARFHDTRFGARFDATPPDTAWPAYLRQEHAQARFVLATEQRRDVVRVKSLQRLRQRPMTAWAPKSNVQPGITYPRMFTPWRIWTIRR